MVIRSQDRALRLLVVDNQSIHLLTSLPNPIMTTTDEIIDIWRVPHGKSIELKDYDPGWNGDPKLPKAERKRFAERCYRKMSPHLLLSRIDCTPPTAGRFSYSSSHGCRR